MLTELFPFLKERIIIIVVLVILSAQVEDLRDLLPDFHLVFPYPVIVVRHEIFGGVIDTRALHAVDTLLLISDLGIALITPRVKHRYILSQAKSMTYLQSRWALGRIIEGETACTASLFLCP